MGSGEAKLARAIRAASRESWSSLNDRELLRKFADEGNQDAFAALVRRHSALVLGACRRALPSTQDAEDACQATFLVLAQKAGTRGWQASVASWLYATARRVSGNALQAARRRAKRESKAAVPEAVEPVDQLTARELLTALDEELDRLPPRYREPIVLCYLEGLTRDQVARRLGVPAATVKTQLERGRNKLGDALTRRGCGLGAGLLALAVSSPTRAVSPRLIEAVLASASGSPPAAVAALAKGVSMKAFVHKVMPLILAVVTAGMFGIGMAAMRLPTESQTANTAARAEPADGKPKDPTPAKAEKGTTVSGRVLSPSGGPVAGAELLLVGWNKAVRKLGSTDDKGRFRVAAPRGDRGVYLLARAPGAGVDFIDLGTLKDPEKVDLRLVKDHAIRGRVIDTEGKPVRGAIVSVKQIGVCADNPLDSLLALSKKRHNISELLGGIKQVWVEGVFPTTTTDKDGRFTLKGAGSERLVSLHFRGAGVAEAEVWVVNRPGFDPRPYNIGAADNSTMLDVGWKTVLYGPNLSVAAEADKPIRGVVKDRDSGKPCVGIKVTLWLNGNDPVPIRVSATTDSVGRYEIRGARKSAKGYLVEVASDPVGGHMHCQIRAADTPGYGPITLDVSVKKGVILSGRVIDRSTGKPLLGIVAAEVLMNNPFAKDYPEFTGHFEAGYTWTARDGTFRIVTIPGPVILMGGPSAQYLPEGVLGLYRFKPPVPDPNYPQYFSKEKRHDGINLFHHYFGLNKNLSPLQWNFAKVLEIKTGAEVVNQDVVLERANALPVKIVDGADRPVSGAWVAGVSSELWRRPVQLEKDACNAYHLEPGKPRLMVFYDPVGNQYGTLRLKGDEKDSAIVKLGPGGTVKGLVIDENGRPLRGVVVELFHLERPAREIHSQVYKSRSIETDVEGKFTIEAVPDAKFSLFLSRGKQTVDLRKKINESVPAGKTIDLGDVKINLDAATGEE